MQLHVTLVVLWPCMCFEVNAGASACMCLGVGVYVYVGVALIWRNCTMLRFESPAVMQSYHVSNIHHETILKGLQA
jgi:hypothetical protein